jgi:Flp pilus assembly protein TadG
MNRSLHLLARNSSGSAAVEMALVAPMLLLLMFGAVDVGYYFLSEHVVDKSVRDAARYAARLPLTEPDGTVNYDCSAGGAIGATATQNIQRVARYGDPAGTTARLAGWTADNLTTVSLTCDTDATHSYVNEGVYTDFPNGGAVPVVTVSASVPYNSLFKAFGFSQLALTLNGKNQAAVIGA